MKNVFNGIFNVIINLFKTDRDYINYSDVVIKIYDGTSSTDSNRVCDGIHLNKQFSNNFGNSLAEFIRREL